LARYNQAAQSWRSSWPEIERQIKDLELSQAHHIVVNRALELLPFSP
jgi:hypothetical protein